MSWRYESLVKLYSDATKALARFPLTIFLGAAATVTSLIRLHGSSGSASLDAALLALALGIPASIALTLWWEGEKAEAWKRIITALGLLAGIAAFFLVTRAKTEQYGFMLFGQLLVASVLLLSFAGLLRNKDDAQFWRFNDQLFVRFALSTIYSLVLFLGAFACLMTVEHLLGWKQRLLWVDVMSVIGLVFAPWFFVAGVPRVEHPSPLGVYYPLGLKRFTQYVLIPLITAYVLILYAYLFQTVFRGQWPKGTIGYLVSGVSLVGIFSLLLLHPIRALAENRWIPRFSRAFYFALFPLVLVLMVGTLRRMSEYGITERRYLLLILGFWIGGVSILQMVRPWMSIRWIPISLFALTFMTAVGPWSAYAVSLRHQRTRLVRSLRELGVLGTGTVVPVKDAVPFAKRKVISGALDYIIDVHGEGALPAELQGMPSKAPAVGIMERLGMRHVHRWEKDGHEYFSYHEASQGLQSVTIAGYDYFFNVSESSYSGEAEVKEKNVVLLGREAKVRFLATEHWLELDIADEKVKFPLSALAETVRSTQVVPADSRTILASSAGTRAKLYVTHLSGQVIDDKIRINHLSGHVFLRVAPADRQ